MNSCMIFKIFNRVIFTLCYKILSFEKWMASCICHSCYTEKIHETVLKIPSANLFHTFPQTLGNHYIQVFHLQYHMIPLKEINRVWYFQALFFISNLFPELRIRSEASGILNNHTTLIPNHLLPFIKMCLISSTSFYGLRKLIFSIYLNNLLFCTCIPGIPVCLSIYLLKDMVVIPNFSNYY